jgi:hypothetical protein
VSNVGNVLIDIDLMIARIEAIGQIEVAPIIANAMHAHVTETANAGTDAYGKAWPRTQHGAQALQQASKHLVASSTPKLASISIQGSTDRAIEGRHHFGNVKGGLRREIVPTRLIPIKLANLIKLRLTAAFQGAAHGRRRNSVRNSA